MGLMLAGFGIPHFMELDPIDLAAYRFIPFANDHEAETGAAWSPDGRYIWYAGQSGDWTYNAIFPETQLYRYDRNSGLTSQMTSRYGSAFRPALSPDGNWLVYGSRNGAQTGLRMRGQRRLAEMHHRRMVDPSGDAGADPFGGAKQDRRPHRRRVVAAPIEHRVQRPQLERHAVLGPAQQRGIAM